MPAYYDEKTKSWYFKCYYKNWQGQKKQKKQRGFSLKREALEAERKFLEQFSKDPDITFETLCNKYKEYTSPRIRESSKKTRFNMIDTHILPYFKDQVISEITPEDIVKWQTGILEKKFSKTYQKNINITLSAIFRYAVDYLGLSKNPCIKSIGSQESRKLNFWTPEEYAAFIDQFAEVKEQGDLLLYTLFETLYYTGMRIGELLALLVSDIDFEQNKIHITKTRYSVTGKKLTNPPKTKSSERVIDIPQFLADELKEYISTIYGAEPDTRMFDIGNETIRQALKTNSVKAGVKEIRIHDFRHSHASTLISLGANPVLVAKRLGHGSPDITLKRYAHLFPYQQTDIVSKIEKAKL